MQRVPAIKTLLHFRQRRTARRAEDRRGLVIYDHYPASDRNIIVLILLLSVTDAILTLYLISHGAMELNPIMAYYLEIGDGVFFLVKYLLTAAGVFLLFVFGGGRLLRRLKLHSRDLLTCFAVVFACVVVWEIFLIVVFVRS